MRAFVTRVVDGIQFIPPLACGTDRVRRARNGGIRICTRRFNVKRFDAASAVGRRDGHLLVCITARRDGRRECGLRHIVVNTIMRALVTRVVDGIQFIPPLARGAYRVRCTRNGGKGICARRLDVKRFNTASAVGRRDGHLLIGVTTRRDGRRECGLSDVVINTIMFALVTRVVDGIQFVPTLAVIADGVRCARHGGERSCARRFNVKSLDTADIVLCRDR